MTINGTGVGLQSAHFRLFVYVEGEWTDQSSLGFHRTNLATMRGSASNGLSARESGSMKRERTRASGGRCYTARLYMRRVKDVGLGESESPTCRSLPTLKWLRRQNQQPLLGSKSVPGCEDVKRLTVPRSLVVTLRHLHNTVLWNTWTDATLPGHRRDLVVPVRNGLCAQWAYLMLNSTTGVSQWAAVQASPTFPPGGP